VAAAAGAGSKATGRRGPPSSGASRRTSCATPAVEMVRGRSRLVVIQLQLQPRDHLAAGLVLHPDGWSGAGVKVIRVTLCALNEFFEAPLPHRRRLSESVPRRRRGSAHHRACC